MLSTVNWSGVWLPQDAEAPHPHPPPCVWEPTHPQPLAVTGFAASQQGWFLFRRKNGNFFKQEALKWWTGWGTAAVAVTHGNSVGSWRSRWRTGHSFHRWSSPYRNIDQWSLHRYRLWTGNRTHSLRKNTHARTHAQSWPYTLLSIMHTEPERNLPAVTYVSRPVGSQWCSQVTCSRLAHSAHSSPPLCDAKSMKDTQKAFHALGRTKPEGTDVFYPTTTIVIIIVDSTNTILHYSHVFVKFLWRFKCFNLPE